MNFHNEVVFFRAFSDDIYDLTVSGNRMVDNLGFTSLLLHVIYLWNAKALLKWAT